MAAYLFPTPEDFPEVVEKLLELADHHRDVKTTTDGPYPLALVVPDALYDRYLTESSSPEEPKKRGRPRKNPLPDQEPTS